MSAQFENNPLGKRYMELDVSPALTTYTGVEIVVDDETSFFAGDESGRVITINNPWGTQEQAENILNKLRGFVYKPYTASGALLDPAAEVGDGATMNGTFYSGIFKMSRTFGSLMAADIAAPQDEEIDHEYPYESKQNRAINRKFSAVESEFAIQSDLISAKVSKTSPAGQTSFSWELTDSAWEVKSSGTTIFRVDSTGATVRGTITATNGYIGGFTIGATALDNGLAHFGTDGIRLGNGFTVDSMGNVSASNMTLSGTLLVGGSYITAASLRQGASYGNSYGYATNYGTTSYPNYFTCGSLWVKASATMASVGISGSLQYKSRTANWQTLNIGGSYYTVLVGT